MPKHDPIKSKKSRLTRRDFMKHVGVLTGGMTLSPFLFHHLIGHGAGVVYAQEDPKRIYIAPDDHTDYFWKADEAGYRDAFLEMIDYYLDLADATAGEPPDFQSRWNCDGSYWFWEYEKNRTGPELDRLIDRVRDGHISFPLNALVVCLGGAPAEAVLRGMYYAGSLERRYNLKVPMAISTENQVLPYGLASLWAGAGAKYSWKGICHCDTLVPNARDREHDIYWMEGPDGSRILMKWNSMLGNNQSMGGYAEARDPFTVVDYVDSSSAFIARYPYRVIGAFGKGWDDLKTLTDEFVQAAKTKTDASRRVIVSNEQDFFEDFETTYGSTLPSQSVTFGNEWDLYCAALAEVSARAKRSVEKLRGAEALAAIEVLHNPAFMDTRKQQRDLAWINLGLFWEHNFGMVSPPTRSAGIQKRIDWQRRITGEIEDYVNTIETDAVAAIGSRIPNSGSNVRFYAFNALSWSRTDVAEIPFTDPEPVHVIDLDTGLETPSQIVTVSGERRLRILAQDVPAVGYKVFEVRPGAGTGFSDAATVTGNVIENAIYRITVADRGAITGLIDKTMGDKEFYHAVNGRAMNDLQVVTGSGVTVENAGPVSVTLVAGTGLFPSRESRITLIRNSRRIEIQNEITQNFDGNYTWSFGFNLGSPVIRHEEVGAIILAKIQTDGGHYSPRASNSRYDWQTLNHFADISDGVFDIGMTLSNWDCYFMKVGESSVGTLDTATPQISVLAGGRVANGSKGLPDQGGDDYFLQRFALRSHNGYDAVAAMRFSLEHQNRIVTGLVQGGDTLPEKTFSFLTISDPNVLLWALKPADDGPEDGLVARIWNLADSPVNFSMGFGPYPITSARQLTHVETPIGDATVTDGVLDTLVAQHQMQTYSLVPDTCQLTYDYDSDDDVDGSDLVEYKNRFPTSEAELPDLSGEFGKTCP
ncbi:Alpha-mannosidase (EC [Olavius algarvensis associated proteobacterium Delta 3]|nr:Alpha-mannosidase (EC [Olavius algarvensis associated proteobacterium Delta 3]CAB5143643.1 Alpha-mannosidase (EC [Olavius algarvensis associated proteobacterium Delta 3]